ncbi:hypothetical protein LSAT2_017772 [Lamellibrachia satsuma]|nr:hypothetical protein LSAT2_017772 [Lamellibrachia satsuma]
MNPRKANIMLCRQSKSARRWPATSSRKVGNPVSDAVYGAKAGLPVGSGADYTAGVRIIPTPVFAYRRYWRVVEPGLGFISQERDAVHSLCANGLSSKQQT